MFKWICSQFQRGTTRSGAKNELFLEKENIMLETKIAIDSKEKSIVVENDLNSDQDVDEVDETGEEDDFHLPDDEDGYFYEFFDVLMHNPVDDFFKRKIVGGDELDKVKSVGGD